MKTINVVVFESNTPRRESLQLLLNDSEGYNCTGAYKDGHQLMEIVQEQLPHILLIDINLDSFDLMEHVGTIKRKYPGIRIIIQSNFESEQLFTAMSSGADGYLLNKIGPDNLLNSIRKINDGVPVFQAAMAQHFSNNMKSKNYISFRNSITLTQTEKQVLSMKGEGYTNKYIIKQLAVSNQAVDFHASQIIKKFANTGSAIFNGKNQWSGNVLLFDLVCRIYNGFVKRIKYQFNFIDG